MTDTVTNVIYSQDGKLYAGMQQENIRAQVDSAEFKSEKKREKAYNKQIKIFNYADGLVDGKKDGVISEDEILAYDKNEKTKKTWKTIGFVAASIGLAVASYFIFKKVKGCKSLINNNVPTALNTKTGKAEQIIIDDITSIPTDGRHIDISAYNSLGNEIGLVRLKADPTNEFKRFMGETGQDCLLIDYWATSPEYKGVGKEMLKKIVHISKESGYEGRVSLQACTGSIPQKFMNICGYGKVQDVSCAIKYKKMGFNAINPDFDAKICQAIFNGESGLVVQQNGFGNGLRDALTCKMELSFDAIKKYLS